MLEKLLSLIWCIKSKSLWDYVIHVDPTCTAETATWNSISAIFTLVL